MSTNKLNFTYLSYKSLYSFQTFKELLLFRIVDPLLHYLFFATIALSLIDTDYLEFILLGNLIFMMSQTMIINLITMFRTEKLLGTLELNVAAPMPLIIIIIKKSIIPILDALLVFIISLTLLSFIFGISFPISSITYLILTILVVLFSLLSVSLILASLGLLFSNVNLFLNLILSIFQIFCGVNFSTNLLPSFLKNFSDYLPTTHVIQAIRYFYAENYQIGLQFLVNEFYIGLIYFFIALILIRIMEFLSKINGSLYKSV